MIIFDAANISQIEQWYSINDGVMGGVSQSKMRLNSDGFGKFSGHVSTENNGGFSSVRYRMNKQVTKDYGGIRLHLKGDGKLYQFRIKNNLVDKHSYIFTFGTSGDWEEVKIPFNKMHPQFRGEKLDAPNFQGDIIDEIGFLIGNKRTEDFELQLKTIELI